MSDFIKPDFPSKYDWTDEEQVYKFWQEQNLFNPETVAKLRKNSATCKTVSETNILNEKFMIPLPPPNVTWNLHIGHSMMLAIQDAMVRFARMQWKDTLRVPWTDHAGISTQVVVEKQLAKQNITRHQLWREKFLEKVWDWAKKSRNTIISQTKKMWSSLDWTREQFTMSEKLSRAVRKSFSHLYDKWKIYHWSYIVNRCHRCQTVLSDIEVKYKEQQSKLYYLKYYFVDQSWNLTDKYLVVATVRPETIFADVAIAVNPNDLRYSNLIWQKVRVPLTQRNIPIITDEHVEIEFGTWALKITPSHDPADFEIWQKHNLPLDLFAIDKDWKLTDLAWKYAWKLYSEVFDNIIEELKSTNSLEKIEEYINNTPRCERCWTRLEPLISKQRFVDVSEVAKKSIEKVENEAVTIHPQRFNKIFFNWMKDIKPRCISRQLRRWHRIPVWHCDNCNYEEVLDEDKLKNASILEQIIFNLIADSKLSVEFDERDLLEVLSSPTLTNPDKTILEEYLQIYKTKYKNNSDKLKEIKDLGDLL